MTLRTDGLAKAFVAGGAIAPRKFVKPTSTAGQVVLAAAITDKIIGASTEVAAISGDVVDVFLSGIVEVIAGGTIAAGDLVTSNSDGNAIVAAPSAGANARIAGVALQAAAAGDFCSIMLSPGMMQG